MVIPVYDAVLINDKEEQGVSVVSLVENPAIKSTFVAYSEEDENWNARAPIGLNEEERMITGAVMIPEKLILRKFNEDYCYVKFSADTIKMCHQKMMSDGNFGRFSLFHNDLEVNNIIPMEIWIKTSEEDKSNSLGLGDLPVGTLFLSAHIKNDEVWNMIKDKQINGFSIESILNYQLTPMRKVIYQAVEVGSSVVVLEGEQSFFSFTGEEVTEDGSTIVITNGVIESITAKEEQNEDPDKTQEPKTEDTNLPEIGEVISRLDSQAEKMNQVELLLGTFMEKFGEVLGAMDGLSKELDSKDAKFQETILSVKQSMSAINSTETVVSENTKEDEKSMFESINYFNSKFKK